MNVSRRPAMASIVAVTAVLALSACDNPDDSVTQNATVSTTDVTTPAESGSTSPTQSTGSTSEPAETSGSPSSSPSTTSHDDSSTSRARQAAVPRSKLPGLNDQWVWNTSRGASGPPADSPGTSVCMRATMTAIGGVAEYSTVYRQKGVPEDESVLTTAVFPDERTAQMAESVLSTWLSKCASRAAKQPGVDRTKVSEDNPVSTVVGTGHQRLVSFGPAQGDPDSGYFNGEGYVRDGDVISYLVIHSVGQDYDYPAGAQPVDLGLKVAAQYLKRTR
jgi:hypothetical protein